MGLTANARITGASKVKTNYGKMNMTNEQNESDAKAHPVDTLVIRHFYGWYEDSEAAPIGLGRQRTWMHNINCKLTRDEQIKFNSENNPDFRLSEYIPPALKIMFR